MNWLPLSVIGILVAMLFVLMVVFADLARGYRQLQHEQHTYCISAISEFCSDLIIADRLRYLAEKWDSIEEKPLLEQLAREQYKPGGSSMPAIWLQYQADRIDPPQPESETEEQINA